MSKIFGIDLGTTYSCIAYVDEFGKPVVVPNQESSPVTPSVVAFEESGNVSVGQAAKETLATDPTSVCTGIKRQMGNKDFTFSAFGTSYAPATISSFILAKLAKDASESLGEEVKDVVITCPAYFGLDEREATKQAGEIAHLNVLAIINEPTAAAISYGLNVDKPETVMVYDLGGGTFDVTIIQVADKQIHVIATDGDHMLGGKEWDDEIKALVATEYSEITGEPVDSVYDDTDVMGELEVKAESMKKQLTLKESTKTRVKGQLVEITREEFEQHSTALLESSISKMHEVMAAAAEKGVTSFDKVLLVGGSTFMPQVRERLKVEFPSTPIDFCDPNQSVAKGAAIYGASLKAKNGGGLGIIVRNVISQSIAVRLVVDTIGTKKIVNQIYKNEEVPLTKPLRVGTVVENQTSVFMEFFENSSKDEYVSEDLCKPLVQGELGPLPDHLPKGAPIELLFKVSEQGFLTIDAKDLTGGATQHLEVQLQNALSEEELQDEKQKVKDVTVI